MDARAISSTASAPPLYIDRASPSTRSSIALTRVTSALAWWSSRRCGRDEQIHRRSTEMITLSAARVSKSYITHSAPSPASLVKVSISETVFGWLHVRTALFLGRMLISQRWRFRDERCASPAAARRDARSGGEPWLGVGARRRVTASDVGVMLGTARADSAGVETFAEIVRA
jgi:hypothetical protein